MFGLTRVRDHLYLSWAATNARAGRTSRAPAAIASSSQLEPTGGLEGRPEGPARAARSQPVGGARTAPTAPSG